MAGRLVASFELAYWRSVWLYGTVRTTVPQEPIRMEATVLPDDYLTASDEMLSQASRRPQGSDEAAASRVAAQVKAIQAVAAAIDGLGRVTLKWLHLLL
jgi:hypothetical protein